jgi:hypothetical protein
MCYVIVRVCTVHSKFTLVNRQIIKVFNVHDDLMKGRKRVEFNSTSTRRETSAVNFETLFGEIKY